MFVGHVVGLLMSSDLTSRCLEPACIWHAYGMMTHATACTAHYHLWLATFLPTCIDAIVCVEGGP